MYEFLRYWMDTEGRLEYYEGSQYHYHWSNALRK